MDDCDWLQNSVFYELFYKTHNDRFDIEIPYLNYQIRFQMQCILFQCFNVYSAVAQHYFNKNPFYLYSFWFASRKLLFYWNWKKAKKKKKYFRTLKHMNMINVTMHVHVHSKWWNVPSFHLKQFSQFAYLYQSKLNIIYATTLYIYIVHYTLLNRW